MFIVNTTTSKSATGSLVDHVVEPSSVDNIHPSAPETTSDHSQQHIPKTASDTHQHTPKGNYCALCKKSNEMHEPILIRCILFYCSCRIYNYLIIRKSNEI
jgi:hypothetical protein